MIKEAYCSFEVAKLLKEKGFNERSSASYDSEGQLQEGRAYWNTTPILYSAPTHQMAMSWLREEYNIIIVLKPATFSGDNCTAWTYELWCGDNFEGEMRSFKTYEEAVEAALKYSLKNLI